MKIAMVAASVAFVAVASVACAQGRTGTYSQKVLLKNWALARCLGQVYGNESVQKDANATASAYLEFGKQPMSAYTQIATLVDDYVHRQIGGSIPAQFNTMKCIDLYHSGALDTLTTALSQPTPQP